MIRETEHLLEGTTAHLLLVEALPAFYDWQDAGFLLASDIDYHEKKRNLIKIINDFSKAREQYMNRKSKEQLV